MNNYKNTIFHQLKRTSNLIRSVILTATHNHHKEFEKK